MASDQMKLEVQRIVAMLAARDSIADTELIARMEWSITQAMLASSGPDIDTLRNLTSVRLEQPWNTFGFRDMTAGSPGWSVAPNDAKIRLCTREDHSYGPTAVQEGSDVLIHSLGVYYNPDITQADIELLLEVLATIKIGSSTDYVELTVPLSELLLPFTKQAGVAFDPANATGLVIPTPAKFSGKDSWDPPEPLYVKKAGYAQMTLSNLTGTPASGGIELKPFFIYDAYLLA